MDQGAIFGRADVGQATGRVCSELGMGCAGKLSPVVICIQGLLITQGEGTARKEEKSETRAKAQADEGATGRF